MGCSDSGIRHANTISKQNEINLIAKISENEVNEDIHFLSNACLREIDKTNTELYIDQVKYDFQIFHKFPEEGEYQIKLKFKFQMKNCESMFLNCKNITFIDLSHFDMRKTENISSMFSHCSNLTDINLFNLETNNLKEIFEMFYCCEKLVSIDLSSINTSAVKNFSKLFYDCKS